MQRAFAVSYMRSIPGYTLKDMMELKHGRWSPVLTLARTTQPITSMPFFVHNEECGLIRCLKFQREIPLKSIVQIKPFRQRGKGKEPVSFLEPRPLQRSNPGISQLYCCIEHHNRKSPKTSPVLCLVQGSS